MVGGRHSHAIAGSLGRSRRHFLQKQAGLTLDDLYAVSDETSPESRRIKLVNIVLEAIKQFVADPGDHRESIQALIKEIDPDASWEKIEAALKYIEPLEAYASEPEIEETVTHINAACRGILGISVPAVKDRDRSQTKLDTIFRDAKDASHITDVVRLRIMPEIPEIANGLRRKIAAQVPDHFDSGWRIKAPGLMDRVFYVEIDNLIAQIQIMDPQQHAVSARSHVVYEAMRMMMGQNQEFYPLITDEVREAVQKSYNKIMRRIMGRKEGSSSETWIYRQYIHYPVRENIEDFEGEALFQRYQELQSVEQSIHREALRDAHPEWVELYTSKVLSWNARAPFTDQIPVTPELFDQSVHAPSQRIHGRSKERTVPLR